jgi:undecaprenyl-diphosphatase
MSIIQAILLGAIQGLTEFIPVSSSGHMLIASSLLGIPSTFDFETLLNIGTLLAAIVYFRNDIVDVIKSAFSPRKEPRLLSHLVVATIPLVIGGVLFDVLLADSLRGDLLTVAMLISVGLLMLLIRPGSKSFERIKLPDAVVIGTSQLLALIPGTSRSGITILTGMQRGFDAAAAAKFSFLLSIPAVGGAIAYTMYDLSREGESIASSAGALIAGNIAAFATSLLAIHGMITFLKKSGLAVFGWYRIALGAILLAVMIIS